MVYDLTVNASVVFGKKFKTLNCALLCKQLLTMDLFSTFGCQVEWIKPQNAMKIESTLSTVNLFSPYKNEKKSQVNTQWYEYEYVQCCNFKYLININVQHSCTNIHIQ